MFIEDQNVYKKRHEIHSIEFWFLLFIDKKILGIEDWCKERVNGGKK